MFKVGQRVKKVRRRVAGDRYAGMGRYVPLGAIGTIVRIPDDGDLHIRYDDYPSESKNGLWSTGAYQVESLTDPKADAFIASIKSLRPYEEPLRTLTEREMDKITGGGA